MPEGFDPKQFGKYMALAQVGLEMAAPALLGVLLDFYLEWTPQPWATISGAVIGLVGGIGHLAVLANQQDDSDASRREDR